MKGLRGRSAPLCVRWRDEYPLSELITEHSALPAGKNRSTVSHAGTEAQRICREGRDSHLPDIPLRPWGGKGE